MPNTKIKKIAQPLLLSLGILSLGLGILGIFLPLLPTTPLLLLATACFARSSEKFYKWLISHPRLGGYIREFNENRSLTMKTKVCSLSAMWSMMTTSGLLFIASTPARAMLLLMALGTTAYIVSLPTLKMTQTRQVEIIEKGIYRSD